MPTTPQPPKWRNRIVGDGEEHPEQLLANPRNWRIHPHEQEQALCGVLDEVGWVQRVIVNKRTGFVVDGHLRIAAAISKGEAAVPVLYVDLSDDEEKKVLATFDPISGMAAMDAEKFKELVSEIEFASKDAAKAIASAADGAGVDMGAPETEADAEPQIDRAAELNKKWQVKTVDLWRIGEHRLLCGDSTKREDVQRALDGNPADSGIADPPYNVGLDYGEATDDTRQSEEFWQWQRAWFDLFVDFTTRQVVTPGCVNLERWITDYKPNHVAVWDKGEGANTHGRVTKYWA